MSKEEASFKFLNDAYVFNELLANISSEGMQTIRNGLEQVDHDLTHHLDGTLLDFAQQDQARFSLRPCDDNQVLNYKILPMCLTNEVVVKP